MNEFDGFRDEFKDWQNLTGDFQVSQSTVNSSGQPVENWVTIHSSVSVNFWTDQSRETSINDKFVDQATGSMVVDPTLGIDTTYRFLVGADEYYITGKDDIGEFEETRLLSWRRQY